MKLPILISARNEEAHIGRTLATLPKSVEPIVIANGCTDNTKAIAERFGARVLTSPEGKMPALQTGLRHLGGRALEPLIMLDADSRPLVSRAWPSAMLRALNHIPANAPGLIVGPNIFTTGQDPYTLFSLTQEQYKKRWETRNENYQGNFAGRNTLMRVQSNQALEALMALENHWPGEDYAIRDVLVENGGATYKSPNLLAAVKTDASRYSPRAHRQSDEEIAAARTKLKQSYIDDRPEGAKRYFKPTDPTYRQAGDTDMPPTHS